MTIIIRILLTILVLGVLIFVHELGHFISAKAFGVRVNEFALGMGPALLKKKGTETLYTVRLFPIGGYCALEGEDGASEDDRCLNSKPIWQRMIIMASGAMMNLLLGMILIALICSTQPIASLMVGDFDENSVSQTTGLQINDKIIAVNGTPVSTYTEMSVAVSRCYGKDTVSMTVERNGEEVILPEVKFPVASSGDLSYPVPDFLVYRARKTVGTVLKSILLQTWSYATVVFNSLADLVSGAVSIKYVSGPVGMSGMISEAASYGWASLCSLAALISVNLCIMNLLPLPALDGGRLAVLLVEAIIRKPVPAKVETAIHGIGFVVLILFAIVIAFKDLFFPIH